MSRVVLDLDRNDISVDDFTEAFSAQIRLVREVMIEMGIAANEVRWVISDLHAGSAYAAAVPQVLGPHAFMADIENAMNMAGAGLHQLEVSSERPKHFNDEALKISRKLVDLVLASSAGKARLVFGTSTVAPSPHTSANLGTLIKGDFPSIGSIDGQLVGVQGTDGTYRIAIKDRMRGRKVPCIIHGDQLNKALENYEKRVIVRGIIYCRDDGTPLKIEARSFDPVLSDEDLPTMEDVRGILRDFRRADGE